MKDVSATALSAQQLLLRRQSSPHLMLPAPCQAQLDLILQAGMRAPDHGGLTPWHFLIVQDEALNRLSQIFVAAATSDDADEAKLEKIKKMPFRAPMIIVISSKYKAHIKVPKQEQLLACGCCVQAMQMAAYAAGLGGVWRTGELSYHPYVKQQLGVAEIDDIVGFLYIGTLAKAQADKPNKNYLDHVSYF
jgi:nitroreductase